MPLARWETHPLSRSLGAARAAWDSLNQRYADAHPMFDGRFIEGLLRHFGDGDEILLRHIGEDGAVDGLTIVEPSRPGTWSSFLPAQAQIAPLLVDRGIDLYDVFPSLPGLPGQIDLLCQDPWFTPLGETITRPAYSKHHALTMGIALDGGFESYWQGRSRNLAANLRRYRHRIEKSGQETRFVRIEDPAAMAAAVARYGELESAGWKGLQGTAIAAGNRQGLFYREILEQFAATGQAAVYEYWIGPRLAASRLTIRNGRMLVILKTAFDECLAEYAPGRQLLYELIRDSFARFPGSRIEFYTHASPEQLAWATDHRHIDHHTLFRNKLVDLVALTVRMAKKSVVALQARAGHTQPPDQFAAESYAPPDRLPAEYAELFQHVERQSFDFGLPWFRNYAATVEDAATEPVIWGATRHGTPAVALPLAIGKGGGTKGESLANYYSALYSPIVGPRAGNVELRFLLRAISAHYPRLGELRFAPLDPAAPSSIALRNALRTAGWYSFSYYCFGNWYLPVTGSWNDYVQTLSGQLRNTIRRMGKKFAAEQGRLEIVTGDQPVEAAIAAFQGVYAASWKIPEPYPRFMPGLIRMLAETGRLRLGIAWLGDQPVAAQIWIVNHGKASIYKLAYHEKYSAYSPGTLLTAHLMQHVMDNDRVSEVDYLIGDDAYKQSWMTHRRERWGLVAYNPKTWSGFWGLAFECIARTAKWLGGQGRAKGRDAKET